jgi:hypothetical protein
MRRREFLSLVGANSVAAVLATNAMAKTTLETLREKKELTVGDLQQYLRSLYEIKGPSCDQIILGSAETKIKKIGTAWMGYWRTCRKAVEAGVNVLVVHEPTFYTHWDLHAQKADVRVAKTAEAAYENLVAKKRTWIDEQSLNIVRCHDVLDSAAEFGIPYALGQTLGFANSDIVRSKRFYNVYRIDPKPAKEVAEHIARRLKPLRQPGVAFYGDENRRVATVGIGTGCICDPMRFADIQADLRVAIDDTVRTWIQTTYAEDSGDPLVVVNHGSSEEPSMKALQGHLSTVFPHIPCVHLGDGCSYRWIAAT